MSTARVNCEHYGRCGKTGHYVEEGRWRRCRCLQQEIRKKQLGEMYDPEPRTGTILLRKTETSLFMDGPLATVRPHVAGALLHLTGQGKSYRVLDAYRLIEIFLGEDNELDNQAPIIETDLLVLLLAYGDPRNRYLPELMLQVLMRRELTGKPTWVVSGVDLHSVASRYGEALKAKLAGFEKAGVTRA